MTNTTKILLRGALTDLVMVVTPMVVGAALAMVL